MPCSSCAEKRRLAQANRQKLADRRAALKQQKLQQAKPPEAPPEKTG